MSTDLPAMRRFKTALQEIATYGGLLVSAAKAVKLAPELVADVEAEGSALIGAVPCGVDHGYQSPAHPADSVPSVYMEPACPDCGAAV